jgi:hypothetical protein
MSGENYHQCPIVACLKLHLLCWHSSEETEVIHKSSKRIEIIIRWDSIQAENVTSIFKCSLMFTLPILGWCIYKRMECHSLITPVGTHRERDLAGVVSFTLIGSQCRRLGSLVIKVTLGRAVVFRLLQLSLVRAPTPVLRANIWIFYNRRHIILTSDTVVKPKPRRNPLCSPRN